MAVTRKTSRETFLIKLSWVARLFTKLLQSAFEFTYPLVLLLFLLLVIAKQGDRLIKISGYEKTISEKSRQLLWPWLHGFFSSLIRVFCVLVEYLFDTVLGGLEAVSSIFGFLEGRYRLDFDSPPEPISLLGNPAAPADDAEKIADMALEIWGDSRFSRSDRIATYMDWLENEPDCIKWIIPPGTSSPIGFTCLFPLKKEVFDRFQRGRMSQRTFEGSDFEKGEPGNIFIQAVAIKKSNLLHFPDLKRLNCYIHSHILEHMSIFVRRAFAGKSKLDVDTDLKKLPVICADICEPTGEQLARHYTFKEHAANTIDKTKIFLLEPARADEGNEPGERRRRLTQFISFFNGEKRKRFEFKSGHESFKRDRVWLKVTLFIVNLCVLFLGLMLLISLVYRGWCWVKAFLGPFAS